jgi:hypothetical protein
MSKEKMSMTIEEDAAAMLRHAAESEHESVSAIAEKAIRHYCINYAIHRVEMTFVEDGRVGVEIERNGRIIYKYRPVPRFQSHGTKGVVIVSRDGPVDRSGVVAALRTSPVWAPEHVNSGHDLEYVSGPYTVRISHLPLEADGNPPHVRTILQRAAAAFQDAEVTSIADVMKRRCPRCGTAVAELRRWAGDASTLEETEWVCVLGHHEAITQA